MTVALASQLAPADFRRLWPALAWGVLLGLATLTGRSCCAPAPALVLAVVVRLLAQPRAGFASVAAPARGGLLVAFVVAASWYSVTWRLVWDYLTGYGYGRAGRRLRRRALGALLRTGGRTASSTADNTDVYSPLVAAAIVCLVVRRLAIAGQLRGPREPVRVLSRFLDNGLGDAVDRPGDRLRAALEHPEHRSTSSFRCCLPPSR